MEQKEESKTENPTLPEQKRTLPVASKSFKVIVLLLFLVVFLGGYFVASEASKNKAPEPTPKATATPNPTANWKTYSNVKYSVKYPSGWIASESITSEHVQEYDFGLFPAGTTVVDKLYPKNPTEYILIRAYQSDSQSLENCKGGCPIIQKATDSSIGMIKARNLVGWEGQDGGCSCNYVRTYFSKDGYLYVFTVYGKSDFEGNFEPISDDNKKLYDRILSTFKFTNSTSENSNSTPTPTTSDASLTTETITYALNTDWQTYADNPAAYELRFPPGYERNSTSVVGKSLYINNCTGGNCSTGYYIDIYNDYDGGSRRAWFENKSPNELINPYYENLNIQGVNALLIMNGDTTSQSYSHIIIPRGNRVYLFSFPGGWNPQTGEKSGLPFIKEVLSTFKFL